MALEAISNGKGEYQKLVAGVPELGKENTMASNAYFAYVFVGVWLGTGKKLTSDDMADVMTDVLTKVKPFFGVTDLNKHPDKWYKDIKKYEKCCESGNLEKYPSTWKVNFDEGLHKDGSYYYFTSCPICGYLTELGLEEIMKPLCETDKVMFAYQHGILYREHTIAGGEKICDYWAVGDKTKKSRIIFFLTNPKR